MKFSLTNRLYTGFSVAILLVLLIGILSYQTFQRQTEAGNWVKHTYQVLNKAGLIEKLLVDMETGHISYRSTAVRAFLKPYTDALQNIKPAINDLKVLVADSEVQTNRVNRIASNIETLLVFWNQQNDDKLGQNNQTAFVDLINREKAFTNQIRDELDQVIQMERSLLTEREKENKASIQQATYKLILGTLLTLVIVLMLIYFTIKEFNSHRTAEAILQENYKELENLNQMGTEKNWLLTGMSILNDNLQDITDVTSLTQSILKTITTYLDLPASAFYCFNEEKQELELNAAIALPGQVQRIYSLGEGLVGQAALDRSLTITNHIPAAFWTIQAASGQALPGQIVCLPIWYNKDLKGVMEFASFQPIPEQALHLLKSVVNNIAVAINAVDYYEKAMHLLEQVQEQKEELENQQEELQQSNEELFRQAEVLQASEQELRVQEEELRQINAELLMRNTAVESARTELAAQAKELAINSQYKSEFLANMSHELRTPLNSVLILAQLLAGNDQGNLTAKQVGYASIIHKSGTDLLELINDILDLSKIEAGKVELLMEQTSIHDIVDDMHQLFEVVADQKGINLATHINKDVPAALWTDRQRLGQIMKNLLSNAFKFTPSGGTVRLSIQVADQGAGLPNDLSVSLRPVLAISVSDTGIGISPEKQEIIFEAFRQADGSINRKFGGTGLGLSISKELIRKLGGELGLQSAVGSGSTFTIYLPLTAAPETNSAYQPAALPTPLPAASAGLPESASLPYTQPAAASAGRSPIPSLESALPPDLASGATLPQRSGTVMLDDRLKGRKVLLVDDDMRNVFALSTLLEANQLTVVAAGDGVEALSLLDQHPDTTLVLIDIMMPEMDGYEAMQRIRADKRFKHLPVIALTAKAMVSDREKCIEAGASDYIVKPVDRDKLFSLMKIWLA